MVLPLSAWAAETTPVAKIDTERTYDLDFTLPTAGKSGCTVCHSDQNLLRPSGQGVRSLYVSTEILASSAHADTPCTGCHIDFGYKVPHQNIKKGTDWRVVARSACKNCHDQQFADVNLGAHSSAGKPGQTARAISARRQAEGDPLVVPTCGDCHGSHQIPKKGDKAGNAIVRRSGVEMCGKCHGIESYGYSDYYHGAAYRKGAPDAPSCWDCHEAHRVHEAKDRRSPVNVKNLEDTCGKCHKKVNADYVAYAALIHGKADIESGVPMYGWWKAAGSAFRSAVQTFTGFFDKE